jgi:hypothetical protein
VRSCSTRPQTQNVRKRRPYPFLPAQYTFCLHSTRFARTAHVLPAQLQTLPCTFRLLTTRSTSRASSKSSKSFAADILHSAASQNIGKLVRRNVRTWRPHLLCGVSSSLRRRLLSTRAELPGIFRNPRCRAVQPGRGSERLLESGVHTVML